MDEGDIGGEPTSLSRFTSDQTEGAFAALPTRGQPMPPSVNYHLWAACNMRCRFCFAPFADVVETVAPRGHLGREATIELSRLLGNRFAKVSFAGGEPSLCGWLPDLIRASKEGGATTMLVTNGTRLLQLLPRVKEDLDWVALSVDSANPSTLVQLGRAIGGSRPLPLEAYLRLGEMVRGAGLGLKLNTVVTRINAPEDLSDFVRRLAPDRWKILRALPVEGQNTGKIEPLLCSIEAFESFVARHAGLVAEGITVVPEDNQDMRGTYAMVDPAGRFFDNTGGGHTYSSPILEVGMDRAWGHVRFSMERFIDRGGAYNFVRRG